MLCRPHRNPRTPGPHQLCCAGPTGTPARQGRTSCAVQAPQEPPHARAAPAVLCRPHRNPREPGPHQLCCAGPTGTPARQGRTSCAVQAPQEPPRARAAPAVLCRPHRNPRTPGPHQLCSADPTGTPARQGRTSCAVQAPQEPPRARAAPAVLCRPHRKRAAPLRAQARAVQGHAGRSPPPLSWGSGGRKQGESGPRRSPNRWSLQPAPHPASVSHRSGHPPPRSGGGLQGNTHRWLLPPPRARTPPPPPDMAAPTPPPLGRCRHTPGQRDAGRLLPCALPRESVSGNFSRRHVLGATTTTTTTTPPPPYPPPTPPYTPPYLQGRGGGRLRGIYAQKPLLFQEQDVISFCFIFVSKQCCPFAPAVTGKLLVIAAQSTRIMGSELNAKSPHVDIKGEINAKCPHAPICLLIPQWAHGIAACTAFYTVQKDTMSGPPRMTSTHTHVIKTDMVLDTGCKNQALWTPPQRQSLRGAGNGTGPMFSPPHNAMWSSSRPKGR